MAAEDLIPMNQRSLEEAKEWGRMGGIESGKTRKAKRLVKDVASSVLSLQAPISPTARKDLSELWKVSEDEVDVMFVSLISIAKKAMKGDTKAFEVIRDTAGEKPTESVKMTHEMGDGAVIRIGYEDDE